MRVQIPQPEAKSGGFGRWAYRGPSRSSLPIWCAVSTFLDEAGEANTGRLGVEDPDARLGGATSTQCYAGGRDTELDIRDRWQAPRPSTLQDKTRQESSHVSNQGADSELELVLEGHLLADLRGFFLEHGQDGQFVRLKDRRLLTVGARGGSRDGTPSVNPLRRIPRSHSRTLHCPGSPLCGIGSRGPRSSTGSACS